MKGERLVQTLRLLTIRSSFKRAEYLRKQKVFAAMGEGCSLMNRTVPLYAKLIRFGNNVHVASNVGFVTHDIVHLMLNRCSCAKELRRENKPFCEKLGCISIGDNVFIGSGTRILYDVNIGSNVVIGSGSLVNRDIPDNCVAAGVPARVIGSFDDFVLKRIANVDYPAEFSPRGEGVGDALTEILWREFKEKRK